MAADSDDFLQEVIVIVRRHCPTFNNDDALEVLREIRASWGGSRPYIPKLASAAEIQRAKTTAYEVLAKGPRLEEAATASGLSRATIYRLLRTKKS